MSDFGSVFHIDELSLLSLVASMTADMIRNLSFDTPEMCPRIKYFHVYIIYTCYVGKYLTLNKDNKKVTNLDI